MGIGALMGVTFLCAMPVMPVGNSTLTSMGEACAASPGNASPPNTPAVAIRITMRGIFVTPCLSW